MFHADLVNPFLQGAVEFFKSELNTCIDRGKLRLEASRATPQQVNIIVAVTGDAEGLVLYSMTERTAKNIASTMTGSPVPVFDELAESALAEMGNIITGQAAAGLEKMGFTCRISPPALVYGEGTIISTVDIKRLVVPIRIESLGDLDISIALRKSDCALTAKASG
ncbi:MAG: chemotaxis protein CheX [Candidatus Fermentithermobacillus carboniphilus]|uniref:Chemotaxis protein CheX n=1 Tax=Candidatus Fermentithermobacillus carboniphilus TaxID=3085328 RepID=A0AAT9LDU3_9FIRM|nr:MAG: chemotaxis protein CheX [Candidatus Fermentithermobacillus carboniphilus]